MNTEESNKLIAEFMGAKWDDEFEFYWFNKPPTKYASNGWSLFLYNESFDWLMPVLEKINMLHSNAHNSMLQTDINWFLQNEIELVYNAVVKFINWYNQNKQS